jgi:hypothetical protein
MGPGGDSATVRPSRPLLGRFSPARFRTIQVCLKDRGCPASYSPKHTRLLRLQWGDLCSTCDGASFIALLGGAAAAWPVAARSQQPERMRRIGVLQGLAASDPEYERRVGAFRRSLSQLGWSEGRNIALQIYHSEGRPESLPVFAAELVRADVDVILTAGGEASFKSSHSEFNPHRRAGMFVVSLELSKHIFLRGVTSSGNLI